MLKKGDIIIYPPYGLGHVLGVVEMDVDGEKRAMYKITLKNGHSTIMLPIENEERIGIRKLINKTTAQNVLRRIKIREIDLKDNWNKRYRDHLELVKSNEIKSLVKVLEELAFIHKVRGLSSRDKQLFIQDIKVVADEVRFVLNRDINDVMKILKRKLEIEKAYDEGGDLWF